MAAMKKYLIIFIFLSISFSLFSVENTFLETEIIKALRNKKYSKLIEYFSDEVSFSFVMPLIFFHKKNDKHAFLAQKGTLYSFLFKTKIIKESVNKNLVCIRDAFTLTKYNIKTEIFNGNYYKTIRSKYNNYNYYINISCRKKIDCKINSFSIAASK